MNRFRGITAMRLFWLWILMTGLGLQAKDETGDHPLRVVLWLGGFAHDFQQVGDILGEELPRRLPLEMEVAWNGGFLDSSDRPDVILMYHCHTSSEDVLTEKQKKNLLSWVEEGVGVVALHASYYSFVEWNEYHDFFGARFIRHGDPQARLEVSPVQGTAHPVLDGVEWPLQMVSELYESTPVAKDCTLLAHAGDLEGGHSHSSVWTRSYGEGRIVTILPGHWPENFRNQDFLNLIVNGLNWTAGRPGRVSERMKQPYDWETDALKAFTLPEGFTIELVAAEPYLTNPVSMTLDEEGRIYVSNAHSYRQDWWLMDPAPDMEPSNPVVRLEPGPDGRAVRAVKVAEGFEEPVMGLAVRDGRLWATHLNRLFVTRLDTQGRMTGERKTLVSDAATPWNPFGMYRIAFGPDGMLYLSVGDHEIELTGVDGAASVRLDHGGSGGIFRFREDGTGLELLLQGMRAPFSFGFTPFGQHWVITNGEGSPNAILHAIYGADYRFRNRTKGDWSWLSGAEPLAAPVWEAPPGSSTEVLPYYSSAFPEEYWGNLFVSNFGIHGEPTKNNDVRRLILDERGRIQHSEPFLTSSDPMFRPTQIYPAPDGSLYLLDWYGKDDENDLTGRLYRIRFSGEERHEIRERDLGSRNHTQRRLAREALLEAGYEAALPDLREALTGHSALAAAEALWTLRKSGWSSAASAMRMACNHGDWRVRRLAVQLLRDLEQLDPDTLETMVRDPDPAVRIEATLGFEDPGRRCDFLVQALQGGAASVPRLRFLAALEIGRRGQEEHFSNLLSHKHADVRLAGLIALDEAFYESSQGYRPESGIAPSSTARPVLVAFIADPGFLQPDDLLSLAQRWPHDSLQASVYDAVMARIARDSLSLPAFARSLQVLEEMGLPMGGESLVRARRSLLKQVMSKPVDPTMENELALLKILQSGDLGENELTVLRSLLTSSHGPTRTRTYHWLVSRFSRDPRVLRYCRELAMDNRLGLPQRLDAVVALAQLQPDFEEDVWKNLLMSSLETIALASVRSLQIRPERPEVLALLERLSKQLHQRHGATVTEDLAFAKTMLSGGVAHTQDKQALRREVLAKVSSGSPELGRLVFHLRGCSSCHDAESAVIPAPKLDGIGTLHGADYLLDSILYPEKSVKTGFLTEAITLQSKPGETEEVVIGHLRRNVSGDGKWDEISDHTGEAKLYPSRHIKKVVPVSVMPSGLEKTMSEAELIDLIAYLQAL